MYDQRCSIGFKSPEFAYRSMIEIPCFFTSPPSHFCVTVQECGVTLSCWEIAFVCPFTWSISMKGNKLSKSKLIYMSLVMELSMNTMRLSLLPINQYLPLLNVGGSSHLSMLFHMACQGGECFLGFRDRHCVAETRSQLSEQQPNGLQFVKPSRRHQEPQFGYFGIQITCFGVAAQASKEMVKVALLIFVQQLM